MDKRHITGLFTHRR